MERMLLVVLILALVSVGTVFADGFTKATFGLGFGQVKWSVPGASGSEGTTSISTDVDFVNKFGFTIGLSGLLFKLDISGYNVQPADSMILVGAGYTYVQDKWCAGGKIVATAWLSDGFIFGIEGGGTFWFLDDLGVGGSVLILHPSGDTIVNSIWLLRVGISIRF